MSHKTKTIVGTAALIASALSLPAYAQDTIPAINDAPVPQDAAPQIDIYQPLRSQGDINLPDASELGVTPEPQIAGLPAPLMTMPVPEGATRSAPTNLYQAPISSLPSIADPVSYTHLTLPTNREV